MDVEEIIGKRIVVEELVDAEETLGSEESTDAELVVMTDSEKSAYENMIPKEKVKETQAKASVDERHSLSLE